MHTPELTNQLLACPFWLADDAGLYAQPALHSVLALPFGSGDVSPATLLSPWPEDAVPTPLPVDKALLSFVADGAGQYTLPAHLSVKSLSLSSGDVFPATVLSSLLKVTVPAPVLVAVSFSLLVNGVLLLAVDIAAHVDDGALLRPSVTTSTTI